ncbi:hypothetical protein ACH3XW_3940 [Acanthocheilonema viteae]
MANMMIDNMTDTVSKRIEDDNMKSKSEKEDGSEKSISSNEDFEIIGSHARISKHAATDDGKSNDPLTDLFKKHIVKKRVPKLSYNLQQEREVESAMLTCAKKVNGRQKHNGTQSKDDCSCTLWKVLFVITVGIIFFQLQLLLKQLKESNLEENEHHDETLEETIIRQQQTIEKLENQLKSCVSLNVYSLPVHVEGERANSFKRKDGFSYFFVIMDWKKNDRGIAQQHLHLAFKQSNSSIYIYDHGPSSGKYFTFGDRIIDIDGITFIKAVDLRDRILWSRHNKDHFTSIVERPATEQALHTVSTLLQPSLSSFSVILKA